MTANDPTGALAGEPGFPRGDIEEGPLPQRVPGSTSSAEGVAESVVERAAARIESEGKR